MKTILTYITLLLIASFVLSSCDPDDEFIPQGPVLLGEGRDYIYFTEGWWKYKNTVTDKIDSSILVRSNIRLLKHTCGENNRFLEKEDITFKTKSLTECVNKDYRSSQAWGCQPSNLLNHYFQFFAKDYCQGFSESVVFFYPFDKNLQGGNSGQNIVFNQLYDSLQVQGQWYYDVAEFELDRDYIWDERRTKYYWAKHVGLIKREKYMNFTDEYIEGWELIDYDVTQ